MDETEEKKFHWKKPREEAVSLFKKKKKKNTDKVNAIFLMQRIFIFSINFLESSQNYFTNNWKLVLKKEKKSSRTKKRIT